MHRGYFKLWRKIEDDPLWTSSEPFDKRSAWIDLLRQAWWTKKRFQVGYNTYDLEPGQFMASLRFLATRWHWSIGKLRRFLKWLQKEHYLVLKRTPDWTQISICNWELYQEGEHTNRHIKSTPIDTATDTQKAQVQEVITLKHLSIKDLKSLVDSQKTESTGDTSSPPKKPNKAKPKPDHRIKQAQDFWVYKFTTLYKTEPILKFARDGKLLKDTLKYIDNNSLIPQDCKLPFLLECMNQYLDDQNNREETYQKPTIPGFYQSLEKIIANVNWENPNWEDLKNEYVEIQKINGQTKDTRLDETSPEHASV